ncbi:hypothetical protein FNV43_RR04159 [Rhamnella rubrinervis]|uniref:Phytocyanin domain-containing protein n=1 Tax=Rhamnella rubrinervis TaxID=2594499 RepID=A0A8K0HLC9_9ROSA|nr:hypothetical protein FNV43_RR04159 [Rhamnella rubrinervis]
METILREALVALMAVLLLLSMSAISGKAAEHLVGGNNLDWSIPPDGNASYALVSKKDFADCNDNDPLWYGTTGPSYVRTKSPGDYYFISTVAKHCVAGQKLSFQVIHNINNNSTSLAPTSTVNAAANIPASSQPSLSPTK